MEDDSYIKHHDLCLTIPNYVPGALVLMRLCEDADNQVVLDVKPNKKI